LAHLLRSITRQRSLQKGNSGSAASTIFLQVGQRKLRTRRFMDQLSVVSCQLSEVSKHPALDSLSFSSGWVESNPNPALATDHWLLATVTRSAPPNCSHALR